jgi:hypothetical protein
MVKVSVEVKSGAARFSVAVRAESIRRALDLAGQQYPGAGIGVRFPIEPEGFFVEDAAASAAILDFEQPDAIAA